MFLHISTDQIICLLPWIRHELPFVCIEKEFGPWFNTLIKQYMPTDLYVLNGPWSFTTLRVCAVALNILAKEYKYTLHTTTKINLFSTYADAYDTFPQTIGISLWQKKQCRLYTCADRVTTKISFAEWQTLENIYIDYMQDTTPLWWDHYAPRMIAFQESTDTELILSNTHYQRTLPYAASCWKEVDCILPAYLIDPTLG